MRRRDPMDYELAAKLSQFALDLQSEPDPEKTVELVAQYARDAVRCDDVGILLRGEGMDTITAAATSERVATSDQIQREDQDGPCYAALLSNELFSVEDTRTETRWPHWASEVLKMGVRSSLGVPLHAHDRRH